MRNSTKIRREGVVRDEHVGLSPTTSTKTVENETGARRASRGNVRDPIAEGCKQMNQCAAARRIITTLSENSRPSRARRTTGSSSFGDLFVFLSD